VKLKLLAAVAVAVLLAGCAPVTEAEQSPSPTSSATETATSTPAPTVEAGQFTVNGAGWTIQGPTGESGATWGEDAPLADQLTELIGLDPVVSVDPGGTHRPDYTLYTWPGLVLGVSTEQKADWYFKPFITISAPRVGTVELRTVGGIIVGAAQGEMLEASAFSSFVGPDGNTVYTIEPDHEVPVERDPEESWDTVMVSTDPDGTVLEITAPYPFGNAL
jgi:hypothetical protein